MAINKTYTNKDASSVHAYEVTPDLLREWANRLESKPIASGQIVRLPFAQDAEFFFDPSSIRVMKVEGFETTSKDYET